MISRRALLATAAAPALLAFTPARKQLLLSSASRGPPGVTLDLNFLSPTLDPRITFTRASTATYFDSTGTLQTAATNAPRWDYNPSTHALNGLLIEEARTNLVVASAGLTGWSTFSVGVALGAGGVPDGTSSAIRITETSTTASHSWRANYTTVASTTYTFSAYAKAQQLQYLQLAADDNTALNGAYVTFDLVNGTITQPLTALGTGVISGAAIQPVGNGFYRCSMSTTVGASTTLRVLFGLVPNGTPGFLPSYAGNAANGLLVWGMQLEQGAFPTSYIPTTAASVTRAVEACSIPTTGWFALGPSSLMAELMVANVYPNSRDACGLTDGTTSNRLALRPIVSASAIAASVTSISGTSTVSGSFGSVSPNVPAKMASSWNGTINLGCLNAGSVVSTAVGLPPALNVLTIGNVLAGSAFYLNGWVRRVRYWPRALTNAELQSVTT